MRLLVRVAATHDTAQGRQVYWRLVRSVRRGRKVVQETVAQLGELDGAGQARAEELARSITGRAPQYDQRQLFDDGEPAKALAVKLDAVRLERSRSFGAVWLGWLLWRALKLDELLSELMAVGREQVAWVGRSDRDIGDWAVVRTIK